ncbi:unnamed protein product, partial [Rotaria sp. Silwood2]
MNTALAIRPCGAIESVAPRKFTAVSV